MQPAVASNVRRRPLCARMLTHRLSPVRVRRVNQ